MTTTNSAVVIDTHALIWYLVRSPRLSVSAREVFESIRTGHRIGIVPTIVLAELMHISERRRIGLQFSDALNQLQGSGDFAIATFNMNILVRMNSLFGLELHDRIIVATALSVGAGLITRDETIRNSNLVECIW